MKLLSTFLTLAALTAASAFAQGNQSLVSENTTKISDHVWAIMGFPNIAIVVGSTATLVVDTGLGPKNGVTIARAAAKLSANKKFFLTTTHYHPEHAAGDAGFPPETVLIRNRVQQEEMDARGIEFINMFSSRSPQNKELLADAKLRTPDIIYDTDLTIDLGGAKVHLMWLGAAHTKGDELILVDPDQTLISGDVVQNKTVPAIPAGGGNSASWVNVLDRLVTLPIQHVLPDHSAPGDAKLIDTERTFIRDVRYRALELKRRGISPEDAGKQMSEEFQQKYKDWPTMNLAGFIKTIYAE